MAVRHRVLIIGAGFGSLAAARELRNAPVDVTIVDTNNFHTFQPLPYQVATAGLDGALTVVWAAGVRASPLAQLLGTPLTSNEGSMATIGRHETVAELPHGPRLRSVIGWLTWLGLHIVYLMGFRNQIDVLVNWAWNYVTYDRGARLISGAEQTLCTEPEPAG